MARRKPTARSNLSGFWVSQIRRMDFRARILLKGIVAAPFSASQLRPLEGFAAREGSPAIQIMNGSNGSLASAEDLINDVRTFPVGTSVWISVSTVSELETIWRIA